METANKTIESYKMFKTGEKVAVACSGGIDSMCLLHYLFANKKKWNIEVCAVNVDHQIRENSANDSKFVEDFCQKNGILCYKFAIDVPKLAKEQKTGLEETARTARYKVFETLLQKGLVSKIAIAHHQQDQVETVLLNIFRGSGLKGACGMREVQKNLVRPLLNTPKAEINAYAKENKIEYVTDQTNSDDAYSRNFLRLNILPQLRTVWKNVDANIINFSKICKQDDDYILSTIDFDDIQIENGMAKIPQRYFALPNSVQSRVLKFAFEKLNLTKDIEKRHLEILKNLAKSGENGSKMNLPNGLKASLEYDCLVVYKAKSNGKFEQKDFKTGKTIFENCEIKIKKTSKIELNLPNCHIIDAKKLPKDAKWRTRQNGDVFAKFGSGEKKLKEYFIDKKVPSRLREQIPVLAHQNQVFCVLGYEISDKVKVDQNTKSVYVVEYKKYQSQS